MASIQRTHGTTIAGGFFGYTPLVILITASGKFTDDTVNATTGAITDGGYTLARKIVQNFGSIVWLGARASGTFACIVDQPTFNQGDGVAGSGVTTGFGALKASLAAGFAGGAVAGDFAVTSGTVLTGAGTFTLA